MMDGGPTPSGDPPAPSPVARLDPSNVTVVYTMFHHLGDFVVMGALLKKLDSLRAGFVSIVAHRDSPHIASFAGKTAGRFLNVADFGVLAEMIRDLRRQRREGRIILGIPMAPGSLQAFGFFWLLKKLGALSYIVDFNLINADVITPPRRRYIYDRHLAQAAEIFKRPEWLADFDMPLAVAAPVSIARQPGHRIGFFPWSGRSRLPEFRWPDANWVTLAQRFLETPGVEIVLLGRDERFAQLEEVLRALLPENLRNRFTARPAASVEQLVASLAELDGLITLNTSALHLAHAMKLPTVALCGSTAEFWLPEGAHIRLVRDERGTLPPSDQFVHDPLQPSVQRIEAGAVFAAATEHFKLRPRR